MHMIRRKRLVTISSYVFGRVELAKIMLTLHLEIVVLRDIQQVVPLTHGNFVFIAILVDERDPEPRQR